MAARRDPASANGVNSVPRGPVRARPFYGSGGALCRSGGGGQPRSTPGDGHRAPRLAGSIEPARLGRFTIGRRLGRGGQGCIYEGFDPELERRVALKIPRQREGDVSFEAKALAKVRHANLVTVYALEICGGRPVLVMELVEGTPLLTWIVDAHPLRLGSWEAIAKVGDGLAELHRCGSPIAT